MTLDMFAEMLGDETPAGCSFEEMFGDEPAHSGVARDPLGEADEFPDTPSRAATARKALEWMSLLDVLEDGKGWRPTLHNVELIIGNDPRLIGLPQFNEFTNQIVQRRPPGIKGNARRNAVKETRQLSGPVWEVRDLLNGDCWSDDRDFAVRSILEAPRTQGGYGMKISDRDLKAATVLAASANRFHPVREYLTGLTWDGTRRVEALFTTYLGAPDDAYTRSVSRLMLLGAIARIFEPGCKFDFAVILEGLQGKRKSTFIKILARSWFAELDGDFHDARQMIELMQGAWIIEMPELSGFNRADVRSIKAFISRQTDKARLAYAHRAGEWPRQCIFVGSTNDSEYLKDDTGGRRFWPIACQVDEIDTAALLLNIDQIWAETLTIYRAMRADQPYGDLPLYLTDDEARTTAARLQENARIETADDALAGRLEEWLSKPINTGSMDEDTDSQGNPVYRSETCLAEIWAECLAGDVKAFKTVESAMLGRAMKLVSGWGSDGSQRRFAKYGKQRVFYRGGKQGRFARLGIADLMD
jgi:predicted P-loop ATPase